MAHKNMAQLSRLIAYFTHDCDVFVNIDKKSEVSANEIDELGSMPQVRAIYRCSVNWGGFSILRTEMFMLREALKHSDAGYFHLISGQDYPVKPLSQFLDFFEQRNGEEFLQYVELPSPRWEGGTFSRFQYYYPYDWTQKGKDARRWVLKIVEFQKRHRLKHRIPDYFDHLYGNSQWFSLSREACDKLVQFTQDHPSHYRRMWMTFAPEESYTATVLMNLMPKDRFSRWNYRFIRWKRENGNNPANLDASHFHFLLERNFLFARKMELPCSQNLMRLIDRYLINEQEDFQIGPTGAWLYDGFQKYSYQRSFTMSVLELCQYFKITSVLDMGCGAGLYVAALRKCGISAAGYDANPYTEHLSRLILPKDDEPCGQADLTDDLDVPRPFDLVICKDVMPYIPVDKEAKALENLAKLTGRFLLVEWETGSLPSDTGKRCMKKETAISLFQQVEFQLDSLYTNKLNSINQSIMNPSINQLYLFKKL